MKPMKPVVNPIHFFDDKGRSALSYEQMEKRIEELEREVEQYKKIITLLRRHAEGEPLTKQ